MNQDKASELNTLIASEKTEISLYLSDAEMHFLQLTQHSQNLKSSDQKFGKRWIIVQVPSVEFFQLVKIFTFPFFLIFFNIPPGKLARTAFLITFVGQILERNRLAQTSLESCREVCRNRDTVSQIVPAKVAKIEWRTKTTQGLKEKNYCNSRNIEKS